MGKVKEVWEDAGLIRDKIRPVLFWMSRSAPRRLMSLCFLGASILVVHGFYLDYLLKESEETSQRQIKGLQDSVKATQYKRALDQIDLCLTTAGQQAGLQSWYCEGAVDEYVRASEYWPQDRVVGVVNRKAYGAMKLDVSHYLRVHETSRNRGRSRVEHEQLLDLLLSRTGLIVSVLVVVGLIIGLMLALARVSAGGSASLPNGGVNITVARSTGTAP